MIDEPIMFVLESPGSSYQNGKSITIRGHTRSVPVKHYYWAPSGQQWPDAVADLPHLYGPYFAYLMARFGLTNVYITNAVKCGKTNRAERFEAYRFLARRPNADTRILLNCASKLLKIEIELHQPSVIFAFGGSAARALRVSKVDTRGAKVVALVHPAARRSRDRIVEENNSRFSQALEAAGLLAGA